MKQLRNVLSKLVPAPIKNSLRQLHRDHVLRRSVTNVQQRLAASQTLTEELLEEMTYGWNNSGWAANTQLLKALLDEGLQNKQSILECGTGVTTLLFSVITDYSGGHLRSLEHNAQWHALIIEKLRSLRLPVAAVTLAPMRDFGAYDWYDTSLSPTETYDFVLCDGPPGGTRGGRHGLLPRMLPHLRPGARIIMDDTCRQQEMDILQGWLGDYKDKLTLTEHRQTFSILTVL